MRSFVYRSFIACDDPNGVIDCKTTRKSKTEVKKMESKAENIKSLKNLENLVTTPLHKVERSIDEFHLKEVSKGAKKLSKFVDSYSKGSFDTRSEDLAKDLLIGAQNLQEMLGKLQENFKKKPKDMLYDGKVVQRSYSERFTDRIKMNEFQKPRLSVDDSSRDCYDELRDVITESFARNNLLPRKVSPDKASASSSQSSMFHSYEVASTDSSSSNMQPKKPRDLNLIAKLMGLEEVSPIPKKSTLRDHLGNGNVLNSKRPLFDIDFPNAKKQSFFVQKVKPEHRTLGEIIEIMEYKGLMKGKSFEGSKRNYSESSNLAHNATRPIVLMKPPQISEPPNLNKCSCGRIALDTEVMPRISKIKERVLPKKVLPQKEVVNSIEKNGVIKRISHDKAVKNLGRPIYKESKVEDTASFSTRTRASSSQTSIKPQKKETIEKRVNKIQTVAPKVAESKQVTEVKSRRPNVSKPNNLGKNNTTKVTDVKGTNVTKPKRTNSDLIPKSKTKMVLHNSGKGKKIVKNDKLVEKESAVFVENIAPENVDTSLIIQQNCDVGKTNFMEVDHGLYENGTWKIREILVTSESFMNRANELFDTTIFDQPLVFEETRIQKNENDDAKLILDCANELLECRIKEQSKLSISFELFVSGICKEIEDLKSYSKMGDGSILSNTLYDVLEREIWGKGMITQTWDLGWKNGFSLREVEEVVNYIQEFLLNGIIEDLLLDFSI